MEKMEKKSSQKSYPEDCYSETHRDFKVKKHDGEGHRTLKKDKIYLEDIEFLELYYLIVCLKTT